MCPQRISTTHRQRHRSRNFATTQQEAGAPRPLPRPCLCRAGVVLAGAEAQSTVGAPRYTKGQGCFYDRVSDECIANFEYSASLMSDDMANDMER
jgi:hypothetical protein